CDADVPCARWQVPDTPRRRSNRGSPRERRSFQALDHPLVDRRIDVSSRSRVHRWAALSLVTFATGLLASGFLGGTPPDEEEFRYAVLTSWLHIHALAKGSYSFWTSLLGFGLPQPFIPNFWFHPLLPLLGILEPATWVRALLLVHAIA